MIKAESTFVAIFGQMVFVINLNIIPLLFFHMIFRKTRTHFHGTSNRPQTHLITTKRYQSTTKLNIQPDLYSNKNPFASFAYKPSKIKKHLSFSQTEQTTIGNETGDVYTGPIEGSLKRKYKNSKNVVKLLDHWGVTSSGFLSRKEFQEKVAKNIGRDLTSEEVDQLLMRHSDNGEYIDSQGLISLLLGRSEGIPIDSVQMPAFQNSLRRQQLTNDLKEDLKNYKKTQNSELSSDTINTLITKINRGVIKMRDANKGLIPSEKTSFFRSLKEENNFNLFQKKMLEQIQKGVNFKEMKKLMEFHKNADYLLVDPIFRKIKAPEEQEQSVAIQPQLTFDCKMKSLPNLHTKTITQQDKRAPFDPLSLLNQDQRKTRFDRSGFTFESTGWNPNCTVKSVQPDQKQHLMQTLQSQAELKRTRYQNKLNIMKAHRQKEQQNVSMREEENQRREKGRLQRVREQQQAYNYINFIKKRWE